MNSNEIKNIWNQYDARLEKNWQLNLKIIKEMNLQKTKSSLRTFAFLKSLSILFFILIEHYLVNYIIDYHQQITLVLPACFLVVASSLALVWNSYHLGLLLTIDYGAPILSIQKKIEQLKISKLRYNQFIFYVSYPYVYLTGFTILHLDITKFPIRYMIPNIALAIIWIPFCYWLIKKYNAKNLRSGFWKKLSNESTLTPDSVSNTINHALQFIKEIKSFEQG